MDLVGQKHLKTVYTKSVKNGNKQFPTLQSTQASFLCHSCIDIIDIV